MKNPPDKCLICGESKLEIIPDDVLQVILSLIKPLEQRVEELEDRLTVDILGIRHILDNQSSPAPTAELVERIKTTEGFVRMALSTNPSVVYVNASCHSTIPAEVIFKSARLLKAHGVEDKSKQCPS